MIAVLVNPNARQVALDPELVGRLRAILGSSGHVLEVPTREQLDDTVEQCFALGADTIGICGGDGTGSSVLTSVVRRARAHSSPLPKIALLRGGTMNTIAKNFGIHGPPDEILARLLAEGPQVAAVETDVLQVNDRIGFVFGAAMAARFFELYVRSPVRPGPFWAVLLASRTVLSALYGGAFSRKLFSPLEAQVRIDGNLLGSKRFSLLVASTIPEVGFGLRPTFKAGSHPDHFHMIASSMRAARLAIQLPRVFQGKSLVGPNHVDRLASHVTIALEKEQSYLLDGEIFTDKNLDLRTGPRITLVLP